MHILYQFQKGEIDFKKYHHVISHSSLLPDLVPLRAYLGKKFPSPREGKVSLVTSFGHRLIRL